MRNINEIMGETVIESLTTAISKNSTPIQFKRALNLLKSFLCAEAPLDVQRKKIVDQIEKCRTFSPSEKLGKLLDEIQGKVKITTTPSFSNIANSVPATSQSRMPKHFTRESQSTKQELSDYVSIKMLKTAIAMANENKSHLFSLALTEPEREPLLYGTKLGQRILLQAYQEIKNKKKLSSGDLRARITQSMRETQKTTFAQVSNFWLHDVEESGLNAMAKTLAADIFHPTQSAPTTPHQRSWIDLGEKNFDDNRARKRFKDDFILFQRETSKWGEPFKDHATKKETGQDCIRDLLIRRSCKWMLQVAHYHQQLVFYALDGLDLDVVAKAQPLSFNNSNAKVPFCTSEIREIFRHWDALKDTVVFYHQLQPCNPPWGKEQSVETRMAWAQYALHLTQKILLQTQNSEFLELAKKMIVSFEKNEFDDVITLLHDKQPSKFSFTAAQPSTRRMQSLFFQRADIQEIEPISQRMAELISPSVVPTQTEIQVQPSLQCK